MAITDVSIMINADDDAMVGSEGWGEYNASASIERFRDMVCNAVSGAFPGADVSVSSSASIGSTRIEFNDAPDHEAEDTIREIIAQIWESWSWLVK